MRIFKILFLILPILGFCDPQGCKKYIEDVTWLGRLGYYPSAVYYLTGLIERPDTLNNELVLYRYYRAFYSLFINRIDYFDEDYAEIKRLCQIDSECNAIYSTLTPSLDSFLSSPLYILGKQTKETQ